VPGPPLRARGNATWERDPDRQTVKLDGAKYLTSHGSLGAQPSAEWIDHGGGKGDLSNKGREGSRRTSRAAPGQAKEPDQHDGWSIRSMPFSQSRNVRRVGATRRWGHAGKLGRAGPSCGLWGGTRGKDRPDQRELDGGPLTRPGCAKPHRRGDHGGAKGDLVPRRIHVGGPSFKGGRMGISLGG